jgi:hypothetical protein
MRRFRQHRFFVSRWIRSGDTVGSVATASAPSVQSLIVALVKAGPEARSSDRVVHYVWNVNVGASAMRPDATKVSSSSMADMSIVLLKLCEPLVDAEEKAFDLIRLCFIRAGSRWCVRDERGNAVARLGE